MTTKQLLLAASFAVLGLTSQAQNYTKYLFAYFPSNDNENIYYALSDTNDPFKFVPMNNGQMIVSADTIALKKGVRDPHVLRGEDGWFYMVNTDMRCAEGWASNRGMVLMRSKDLVNWQHSTVHFPEKYKGTNFANVTRVWAPETIWDPKAKKYLVYFSLLTNDGTIPYDKVYYCYANEDFTDLEGEPTYFYDRGSATIDMDIVFNEKDQLYHAFYKNEGEGGICKVTAKTLTPEEGKEPGSQWSAPSGKLQQTRVAVEGAGIWPLINADGTIGNPEKWILMYDCYGSGYYQFCESTDLTNFTLRAQTNTSGMFTPRHGTVLPVTDEEVAKIERLLAEKRRPQVTADLRAEIETAQGLGVDVASAKALLDNQTTSIDELVKAVETLKVMEYEQVMRTYSVDATDLLDAWNQTNVTATQKGQHWDGTNTTTYFEQRDGWAQNAWQMSMSQQTKLPAGNYVLKVACRSASDAVNATVSVGSVQAAFPHKADVGFGISLDGKASFNAQDGFANGGAGRGWEWRYVPFTSDGNTPVNIAFKGLVNGAGHQWLSFTNISLLAAKTSAIRKALKKRASAKRVYDLSGRVMNDVAPLKAGNTDVAVVISKSPLLYKKR